jgi:hypothetical protein
MMGQISRAFLFFMMLLTGMSAAEAARVDGSTRISSEELALVLSDGIDNSVKGHAAVLTAPACIALMAIFVTNLPISHNDALTAICHTTPLSRHDLALE